MSTNIDESTRPSRSCEDKVKVLAESLVIFLKAQGDTPTVLRSALLHAHQHPEKSFGECLAAVEPECRRVRHAAISQAQREIDALMAKGNPNV